MTNSVLYETEGAIAVITLNRPAALNSFDTEMRTGLAAATARARDDTGIRAVILTGAGRAFSAGADLKAGFKTGADVERIVNEEYAPSLLDITEMEKPVISAVNGFAAGIGLSYALACDLSVMGENAFLLCPFSAIGLIPDGGSTWLLTHTTGYKNAYEMAVENDRMPAARCRDLGLVNKVVADGELMDTAREWAGRLAGKAPLALARTKKMMRRTSTLSYAEAISAEAALQRLCFDSADCKEGVTAFLEKREPRFTGS